LKHPNKHIQMKINAIKHINLRIALTLVVLLLMIFNPFMRLNAASLTNTSVRLNRMKASTNTTMRITFTVPAGNAQTEEKLMLSLPDNFTVAPAVNYTSSVASCGATSLPGTLTFTASDTNGSKHITISGLTNLSASTSYCVDLTNADALGTGAAGQYSATLETQTSGAVLIDSVYLTLRIITDDQIVVNAVVPPTFNFVLDGNTTSFTADLDTGVVRQTAERTVTITTNSATGWIAWARGLNTGLASTAAGYTIAATTPGTGATLSSGTEGYVLGVDSTDAGGGGTVTVEAAYAGTNADADGSGLDTNLRQIATADGTANGDILRLYGKAAINGFTPAANDYTDTWTVIGAGSY
jgi:hypothetical protein